MTSPSFPMMGNCYSTIMLLSSTCAGYRCWRKVKDDGTSFHVECPRCDYKKLFCSPVHRSEQEARHNRQYPEQQANQTAAELAGPATASPEDSESVLPQQSSENCASAAINGPAINNATAALTVDDIATAAAPQCKALSSSPLSCMVADHASSFKRVASD